MCGFFSRSLFLSLFILKHFYRSRATAREVLKDEKKKKFKRVVVAIVVFGQVCVLSCE